ncbi:hypothetical protein [Idiomarina sp. UBA3162]|uniref:hypothetical protein n=1 Tax=Idiomarina sp. UBA3162 TaxID=1946641 RepID=UPI000C8D01E7|nr:hypothetical protein [Idiomarina sp. UBA3162]MAD52454.1 hypothetical protein [Idiomarinaceae bacterium]|tara:strand:- start:915 stop:2006 length:1092 start_codon:yes stop_codon:yes gene_type:complete
MDFHDIRKLSDEYIYDFLFEQVNVMFNRTDHNLCDGEKGRLFGWYWGYYGRAILDMYRATEDIRFKELFLWSVYRLLEVRDDVLGLVDEERSRLVAGWGSRFKNGKRACEITTTGLIVLPIAEYAALYGSKLLESETFVMLNEFISEFKKSKEGGYFFHLSDDIVEALNHSHLYGAALAHASRIESAPDNYKRVCKLLLKYFNSFTSRSSDGLIKWPYSPSPGEIATKLSSEALWKAGATVELPVAMLESRIILDDNELLTDLVDVLRKNKAITSSEIPQFIDSDREIKMNERFWGTSSAGFISSWVQFNNLELNEIIIDLVMKKREYFPNGWLGERYPDKGGSRTMIMAFAHLRRTFPHLTS